MAVPHSPDYCSFVLSFESRKNALFSLFFFLFLIFIGVELIYKTELWLIYNIVLVSGIQQSQNSEIYVDMQETQNNQNNQEKNNSTLKTSTL